MNFPMSWRKLHFVFAFLLCPALVFGSFSTAFAASVVIDEEISAPVSGNDFDATPPVGNEVRVTEDGWVHESVYGAYSSTADVTGNRVILDAFSTVDGIVYGGYARNGFAASGNTVTQGNGSWADQDIYGGYSTTGAAMGNSVVIDGIVYKSVYGGRSEGDGTAQVSGNSVTLTDNATMIQGTSRVYGGMGNGIVSDNSVTIDGGIFYAESMFGGRAYTAAGQAINNTVFIRGGNMSSIIYGGYASAGTAAGNAVIWTNGLSAGNIYGAYAVNSVGNSVTLDGVDDNVGGSSYIYGGYGADTASNNSVSVNRGYAGTVVGGRAETGDAIGNQVTLTGGFLTGYIAGGQSDDGAANNNSVFISGGIVDGDAQGAGLIFGGAGETSAINNTVTISGAPHFGPQVSLYGGSSTSGDAFSGNTLNLHTPGLTVDSLANFEHLNFYLPVAFNAADPVLYVVDSAYLTDSFDESGRASTINVRFDGTAPAMGKGEQLTLIDAGTLVSATNSGSGRQGATLEYEFGIAAEGGKLLATVDSVHARPQAKTLSEGFLGGLALTTQGADLAAGQGMANAMNAVSGNGFGAFGALSGGSLRYDTGSHVDMNSVSLMTGLAWGVDTTPGHLTLGAFFEYGTGSYDTHNSFSNAASVDGDGDADYIGGGLLGRMDFSRSGPGHFYAEASARLGTIENDYASSDLRDDMGRGAYYDTSSMYYGLHLGGGYVWDITEKTSLDLYGKYFWTRAEGDSVTLSAGDPVSFKDADSLRLRGGARLSYAVNEYVSPYVGAAYEHEFDGRARATTYGYGIDTPELTGGTGIGELGLRLTPSATLPLSFDLGVQGYIGQREGVTGSLQVKFEF